MKKSTLILMFSFSSTLGFATKAKSQSTLRYEVARAIIGSFNELIGPPFGPKSCLSDLADPQQITRAINTRLKCGQLSANEIESMESNTGCANISDLHAKLISKCSTQAALR